MVGEHLAQNLVLGFCSASAERDHGDRRPQPAGGADGLNHRAWTRGADPVCAHRIVGRLQVALAQVLDVGIEHRRELVARFGGHHDFAGPGKRREARGEIGVTAVDVLIVGDEFSHLHAHAQ